MRFTGRDAAALAVSLALCFLAAGLGGLATSRGIGSGWYAALRLPDWRPPDWVFGPVWTALYLMMAAAAWLVWRAEDGRAKTLALTLFATQLALNALWPWLFFAFHWMGWACVELGALWLAIVATALAFWPHSPVAAVLLVPYAAWVAFAGVLNFTIWQLNRGS